MRRQARQETKKSSAILDRHNEEEEIYFSGQAFQRAATILVNRLAGGLAPWSESDSAPIFFLYREAAERNLKAIILGHGSNFLPAKPVPARISWDALSANLGCLGEPNT